MHALARDVERMPRRSLLLFVATTALIAGCTLHSVRTALVANGGVLDAGTPGLVPGVADVGTLSGNWRLMAPTSPTDSTPRAVGGQREEFHETTFNGTPAVMIVKASTSPTGAVIFADTLMMLRDGFTPVWERMHSGKATKVITYDGPRIHQQTLIGDSIAKTFDREFSHRPFGFNQLELLFRSIPMQPGLRLILPLYSEGDDSVEMDTLSMPAAGAFRFGDPAIVTTYSLDERRQFASYAVASRRGSRFWRTP